jgi:hypothetical protein
VNNEDRYEILFDVVVQYQILIPSSEFSGKIILESMEQRCISISKEFPTLQAD